MKPLPRPQLLAPIEHGEHELVLRTEVPVQGPVYEAIGKYSRDDAKRVAEMCYHSVTVTESPRPESPEEIRDALIRAANFVPKERIGSTDDCGFSPFSIDEKPNHDSPDYAREIAFQKTRNRVEGTKMAANKLGIS